MPRTESSACETAVPGTLQNTTVSRNTGHASANNGTGGEAASSPLTNPPMEGRPAAR